MDENSRWHFDYDEDCLEENKHGDDDDFLEKTIKESLWGVILAKSDEIIFIPPSWCSDLFNHLHICTGMCHISRTNGWSSHTWIACGCPYKPEEPDPPAYRRIDILTLENAVSRARENPRVLKYYFEILKNFWEIYKDDESFQKLHEKFPYGHVNSTGFTWQTIGKLLANYWQTWENLVRKTFIEYVGWKEDYSIGR